MAKAKKPTKKDLLDAIDAEDWGKVAAIRRAIGGVAPNSVDSRAGDNTESLVEENSEDAEEPSTPQVARKPPRPLKALADLPEGLNDDKRPMTLVDIGPMKGPPAWKDDGSLASEMLTDSRKQSRRAKKKTPSSDGDSRPPYEPVEVVCSQCRKVYHIHPGMTQGGEYDFTCDGCLKRMSSRRS